MLHDVTEQKQAQARLVEHERALATFEERDRLARELHDSLGQVLGYAKMQAQAARDLLARQEWQQADQHLTQLVAVAQDAHADVREYILGAGRERGGDGVPAVPGGLSAAVPPTYGFAATLEARRSSRPCSEPTVGAQLLRIIQEALTNARKHAHACG